MRVCVCFFFNFFLKKLCIERMKLNGPWWAVQHIIACGGRREERDGVRGEGERRKVRRQRQRRCHKTLRSLRSRCILLSLSPGFASTTFAYARY